MYKQPNEKSERTIAMLTNLRTTDFPTYRLSKSPSSN